MGRGKKEYCKKIFFTSSIDSIVLPTAAMLQYTVVDKLVVQRVPTLYQDRSTRNDTAAGSYFML